MKNTLFRFGLLFCLGFLFVSGSSVAQDVAESVGSGETLSAEQLTLEAIILNGGVILWAIMGMGFVTLILAMYLFFTITPRREAPAKLLKRVANQIRAGELYEATRMCDNRSELMARVLYSGLRVSDQERYIIQEAMESEGERGAAQLWQRISYLNNVGAIAPLVGLLGTVWGMIGAFSAIALDNSQVKGLTMAYSVSQAMITTAAGLLLAIPALLVYYYLRGRVLKVIALVESQASEFVELIVRHQNEQ
jgi:biopolymer transport protein ExbB